MNSIKPVFFGCAGEALSAEEEIFFRKHSPLGFILFARNCNNPAQVKALTTQMREITGREDTLILIDQEGGRVARLKPPHWREYPAAGRFGVRALHSKEERAKAQEAVYANARLIARELYELGINVDCAPMADVRYPVSHDIIGDRAFSDNAYIVSLLSLSMAKGLWEGGVLPVLKHIPGHGRATSDSHEELPVVDASLQELESSDFIPFKALNFLGLGMTAHILYTAVDPDLPATLSPKVIDLIRTQLGFDGLLMSDDMSMKALGGDLGDLSRQALAAGCDTVLHCNGKMDEMRAVAEALDECSDKAVWRHQHALAMLRKPDPFDYTAAVAAVEKFLA